MSLTNVSVKVNGNRDYNVKKIQYGANALRDLNDVYSINPTEGDVLVFNAITGKYISKKIDLSSTDLTNIDAGTF